MSCICQQCGKNYRVDFLVPDNVWEKIKPSGKAEGAGLLCGACIMNKIESFGEHEVIHAVMDNNFNTNNEQLTHNNSPSCWCEPELGYKDPATGNEVWVHREIH